MSTKENNLIDDQPIEANRDGLFSRDKLVLHNGIVHSFTSIESAQARVSHHAPTRYAEPKPVVTTTGDESIKCPRCKGSGYVEWADIQRLHMGGRWWPGTCRYCEGSGIVSPDLLRTRGVTEPPP